ncbi:hypothetical protein M5689_000310 [Euphorbia peplus]|nr:hypothetical protein M5689_000310 [Euphorbia peplus]
MEEDNRQQNIKKLLQEELDKASQQWQYHNLQQRFQNYERNLIKYYAQLPSSSSVAEPKIPKTEHLQSWAATPTPKQNYDPVNSSIRGSNVDYSKLTSFLSRDNSLFSPWNWNQNPDEAQNPIGREGEGERMVFQNDSYFSHDLFSTMHRRPDSDVEQVAGEFLDRFDTKKNRCISKKSKKKQC